MHRPNFQVKSESGKTYWISRSVAVVVVPLFHCKELTYVPLGKRAENMVLCPGHWGLPCGFLDWGESASESARREVLEELGLDLYHIHSQPDVVISDPNPAENETVSLRFVVHRDVEELPPLYADGVEVSDTKWLETSLRRNELLAFNHTEIIDWALELKRRVEV